MHAVHYCMSDLNCIMQWIGHTYIQVLYMYYSLNNLYIKLPLSTGSGCQTVHQKWLCFDSVVSTAIYMIHGITWNTKDPSASTTLNLMRKALFHPWFTYCVECNKDSHYMFRGNDMFASLKCRMSFSYTCTTFRHSKQSRLKCQSSNSIQCVKSPFLF